MSACHVPTVHSTDFTLGGGIGEDPMECTVECEFGQMSGSGEQARFSMGTCNVMEMHLYLNIKSILLCNPLIKRQFTVFITLTFLLFL